MKECIPQVALDRTAYELALDYLLRCDPRVTSGLVEKYLCPLPRPQDLAGVFRALLESAHNANMKAGVIRGGIGGIEALGPVLDGFDPSAVCGMYANRADQLLEAIVKRLRPKGKIRREKGSVWPQFCKTILSAASFLAQFDSHASFFNWLDRFDADEIARPALPLLLAREVHGIGFALACDFIKELGYVNFGKPDVQIKKLFQALGLASSPDDYLVFKDILRVARNVGQTPYNVDKIFWLIGSGNFYIDNLRIGNHRNRFIRFAKESIKQMATKRPTVATAAASDV